MQAGKAHAVLLEPMLQAVEARLEHHVRAGEMRAGETRLAAVQLAAPQHFGRIGYLVHLLCQRADVCRGSVAAAGLFHQHKHLCHPWVFGRVGPKLLQKALKIGKGRRVWPGHLLGRFGALQPHLHQLAVKRLFGCKVMEQQPRTHVRRRRNVADFSCGKALLHK